MTAYCITARSPGTDSRRVIAGNCSSMTGNTVIVGRCRRVVMDTTGEDGCAVIVAIHTGRDVRRSRVTTPCVTVVAITKFRRTVTTAAAGVAEGTSGLVDGGDNIGICRCIMASGSTTAADRGRSPGKVTR